MNNSKLKFERKLTVVTESYDDLRENPMPLINAKRHLSNSYWSGTDKVYETLANAKRAFAKIECTDAEQLVGVVSHNVEGKFLLSIAYNEL
jgi:hypothetical protein